MLSVSSDVFAKNVELSFGGEDPRLSDNFFDIATKEPVLIFVESKTPKDALLSDLAIRSVYDIPSK